MIHLRTRDPGFGGEDVRIFIEDVLPRATGVDVQVAHLGGWGGYDEATEDALRTFIECLPPETGQDGRMLFDLSAVVRREPHARTEGSNEAGEQEPARRYEGLAAKLRSVGLHRVLFGTDWPDWRPRQYLTDVRENVSLTDQEIASIVANRAGWVA